jgi:putative transposase
VDNRQRRHVAGVLFSMDGKGRFLDNIFIERLWRSLKYEEVFIKAYVSVAEARNGIGAWLAFYNDERLHQALGYRTPREVFEAAPALWMWTTQARCPHPTGATTATRGFNQ